MLLHCLNHYTSISQSKTVSAGKKMAEKRENQKTGQLSLLFTPVICHLILIAFKTKRRFCMQDNIWHFQYVLFFQILVFFLFLFSDQSIDRLSFFDHSQMPIRAHQRRHCVCVSIDGTTCWAPNQRHNAAATLALSLQPTDAIINSCASFILPCFGLHRRPAEHIVRQLCLIFSNKNSERCPLLHKHVYICYKH